MSESDEGTMGFWKHKVLQWMVYALYAVSMPRKSIGWITPKLKADAFKSPLCVQTGSVIPLGSAREQYEILRPANLTISAAADKSYRKNPVRPKKLKRTLMKEHFKLQLLQLADERDEQNRRVLKVPRDRLGKRRLPISMYSIGEKLCGRVINIKPFGVWVDIGCYQNGLLHIKDIDDGWVKDTAEYFEAGELVNVTVKYVDVKEGVIGLTKVPLNDVLANNESISREMHLATAMSMRRSDTQGAPLSSFHVEQEVKGKIKKITSLGFYVDIGADTDGFLHVRDVDDPSTRRGSKQTAEFFEVGQVVEKLYVKSLDLLHYRIQLSARDWNEELNYRIENGLETKEQQDEYLSSRNAVSEEEQWEEFDTTHRPQRQHMASHDKLAPRNNIRDVDVPLKQSSASSESARLQRFIKFFPNPSSAGSGDEDLSFEQAIWTNLYNITKHNKTPPDSILSMDSLAFQRNSDIWDDTKREVASIIFKDNPKTWRNLMQNHFGDSVAKTVVGRNVEIIDNPQTHFKESRFKKERRINDDISTSTQGYIQEEAGFQGASILSASELNVLNKDSVNQRNGAEATEQLERREESKIVNEAALSQQRERELQSDFETLAKQFMTENVIAQHTDGNALNGETDITSGCRDEIEKGETGSVAVANLYVSSLIKEIGQRLNLHKEDASTNDVDLQKWSRPAASIEKLWNRGDEVVTLKECIEGNEDQYVSSKRDAVELDLSKRLKSVAFVDTIEEIKSLPANEFLEEMRRVSPTLLNEPVIKGTLKFLQSVQSGALSKDGGSRAVFTQMKDIESEGVKRERDAKASGNLEDRYMIEIATLLRRKRKHGDGN